MRLLPMLVGLLMPACAYEGAAGLPMPGRMDFSHLQRPSSPNTSLAAPAGFMPAPDIATGEGRGVVETFTINHGGEHPRGVVIGRLADGGARFVATTSADDPAGVATSLTWAQLSRRTFNVGRELSVHASVGDRAMILAPRGAGVSGAGSYSEKLHGAAA